MILRRSRPLRNSFVRRAGPRTPFRKPCNRAKNYDLFIRKEKKLGGAVTRTRQEILSAVEEGAAEGIVGEQEREMIESVIELKDAARSRASFSVHDRSGSQRLMPNDFAVAP